MSAIALLLACSSLQAADLYVWRDESGRRQISDVVPDQYRAKAKKVDVPSPSNEDLQRQAEALTDDARSAAAGGSAAPVEQPVRPVRAAADCQTSWQLYLESRECLAFYEYALRGLDADPRASCPVVLAPSANCGPTPAGIPSR